ncbi:MAG: DegV family protein [Anaerolineae bacterium]
MIRIITDSTCEAPPALLSHPLVTVVPLYVIFGQESYRDGIEMTREQFWARLPKSSILPTTSQATPADFEPLFRSFTEAGDEVIAILLSAKLSRTYQSALVARDSLPGMPIDVVDSKSISIGLGLLVEKAVEMATAGATRQEIVAKLEDMREKIRILFSIQTLEYLQRGGRIGKAQAFVGTLLQFKPLLSITDGEVHPAARVRSTSKALETMQDLLAQQVSARGPQVRIGVTHAGVPDAAAEIAAALGRRFDTSHTFVCTLGPVIGTHVGPGTIGAAVYGEL